MQYVETGMRLWKKGKMEDIPDIHRVDGSVSEVRCRKKVSSKIKKPQAAKYVTRTLKDIYENREGNV